MPTGPQIEIVDSGGRAIRLEKVIGKGGEGIVFEVEGAPKLAAKVYHQSPLEPDQVAKLEAMVAQRTNDIDAISAWPSELLFTAHRREMCGILIPRVVGSQHLHELYGTANRRLHFPEVQWHHLVLAARNVAAAFDTMHEAGILIGDVNQGNLLVNEQMVVRFIDCDSFQITSNGRTFTCPVGTPHFTPPELQAKKLRDIPRQVDHDLFGLGVLLFHLIFVGRHPFAGRFHGAGELTIERAIAERRFAFSRNRAATLVEPPPASLLLDDVPGGLAQLFELAFCSPDGQKRPRAAEWVAQLDVLLKQRKRCSIDPAHVYYAQLLRCPWCRIEDEGGPAFFVAGASGSMISRGRLDHLEAKVRQIELPTYPPLTPQELKIPQAVTPKRNKSMPKLGAPDLAVGLLAASALACVSGVWSPYALAAGAVGSLAGGLWLLLGKEARRRRGLVHDLTKRLEGMQGPLFQKAQSILKGHQQRAYWSPTVDLRDALVLQRSSDKRRYLSSHLIQEHMRAIPGMTPSLVSVLQSYGIESAADVEAIGLHVPMLSGGLTLELKTWRDRVEQQFVHRPAHAMSMKQAAQAGDVEVSRFKAAQARRILMGAAQLSSMARLAGEQLAAQVGQYDQAAAAGRAIVKELRDTQSIRRSWERAINSSWPAIVAATIVPPLVGLAAWWLFG
jgi:DNA-binding helix-hairpin-helix protein with protein kinase domain